MAMVTNYLVKMWISVIALKPIVPSHNILLKLLSEFIKHFWQCVSHNGDKYSNCTQNVKQLNSK